MFYETRNNHHGLAHDPFKAIVAPRPIGWISTLNGRGEYNVAPYSFFNAVSSAPPIVFFSSIGWKDSAKNARDTGEFVCNYVGELHEEAMNKTSVDAPGGVNEADYAGLALEPSEMVAPARIKNVWAALECKVTQLLQPHDVHGGDAGSVLVFGEVVGIYIRDDAIVDGQFEVDITRPITRGGYLDFGRAGEKFQMPRPVWDEK